MTATWFKLHDEYGHGYREIAKAWGYSYPTVRREIGNYND